jgi:hypothetical protein
MDSSKDQQEMILRSLEEQWIKDGKTKPQIRKLRYWHKNKQKLLGERRSLKLGKIIGR